MSDLFRLLSLLFAVVHIPMLFFALFESRYTKKKGVVLLLLLTLPILAALVAVYLLFGITALWFSLLATLVLPELLSFLLVARHRDFRFFFTFFFVQTVTLTVILATALIDRYLLFNTGIFALASRIVLFPLLLWITHRFLRRPYVILLETIEKGWEVFSAVSFIYFLLILITTIYPVNILSDPTEVPSMLLLMVLTPMTYVSIFRTLLHQKNLYEMEQQTQMLELERSHIKDIVIQNAATEERIRIERHDLRHRFKSILAMLEQEKYDEALEYIRSSTKFFDERKTERYCKNPIVDAVLSTFFKDAADNNIRVEHSLAIPNELPVDPTELSIVFANALENAINACKKLPDSERVIRCKYVTSPHHMFQISNPYKGKVSFDENGRPLSFEEGHGIGTRSIMAFCEKYGAELDYKTKNGWFYLRIVLSDTESDED